MASIYNIPTWAASTSYRKNSIVINNNAYFYALSSHTSTSSFSNDLSNGLFGGTIVQGRETKPYFLWTPSYPYRQTSEPKVKTIQFSDGYSQKSPDGLSNILLSFDFSFSNRNLDEYSAIIHFLQARLGAESFVFMPPAAYSTLKKFVCPTWTDTQNFFDNYTIDAKFTEVVT
jgi:phage-related protein